MVYNIDQNDIVLGFISNNWPRKGLDLILSALALLPSHFKLVIAGNHKPSIRNIDEAMKRRLHMVPFTVRASFTTGYRASLYSWLAKSSSGSSIPFSA